MDNRNIAKNDEIEIDLLKLGKALLNKVWLIGLAAIVCAAATLAGTYLFVMPQYQSSVMFYVNNAQDGDSVSISAEDISVSRGLVKSYIVILKARETLNEVITCSGVNRTYEELNEMITADAVDSTEIFRVVVTGSSPEEAETIANAIERVLPARISHIIESATVKVLDSAVVPSVPSSPDYVKNTAIGFLAGLILAAIVIILRATMDTTICDEADIARCCNHPVLAVIPEIKSGSKGEYVDDSASEAYKLLRTKLQLSSADSRIIGVSSAWNWEGRSLTAVNLARSMSQLNKRVLLIECDMRHPSIAEKLRIHKAPGLSEFLSGQGEAEELLQLCDIGDDTGTFHAIASGKIPSNPMELLSSNRMIKLLDRLRCVYDYIILDLPPVGEVGDALAVSKLTDGMLLVVRQNYCDSASLDSAVRQFTFVGSQITGIVLNCVERERNGAGGRLNRKSRKG